MANNIVNTTTSGIGQVLAVLAQIGGDVTEAKALINLLGWDLPPGVEDIGLASLDSADFLTKLDAVLDASEAEWNDEIVMAERIAALAVSLKNLVQTIRDFALELPVKLAGFGDYVDRTNIHKELPVRLFNFLLVNYLARASPLGFAVLHLIDVIDFPHFEADPENFQVEHIRATLNFQRFKTLFTDPAQLATDAYGWNTPQFTETIFLQRLHLLFQALGMRSRLQPLDHQAEDIWLGRAVPEPGAMSQLITFLHEERGAIAGLRLGFSVFGARPSTAGANDGGLGIVPIIQGRVEGEIPFSRFDDTFIDFSGEGDLLKRLAMILRPGLDLDVRTGNGVSDLITGRFALGLRFGSPDSPPKTLLALPGGAGIQFREFSVKGGIEKYSDRPEEAFMEIGLSGGELVLSMAESDSFLSSATGGNDLSAPFDLRIGWNSAQGIYFQGGAGLSLAIPVPVQLGPFRLQSIQVALASGTEDLKLELSASGSVLLGPLTATVGRLGVNVALSFGEGNLGFMDVSPRFKPPTSIGLVIDGGGFKGGGFLEFEPEAERYTGFLELEFQGKIALKAIGLLETRLPNSQDGYSLLILITAEFTPIQLGFGFTLNGVGGLLGLNRTVDVERLRTGIRDNTLSSILFPQNVVENAARIISDLRQVFPPQEGRFVFGPMAKIGWGSPTIITLDLGLLIEVPNPVRLLILGVLKGILPKEEAPVLRLQVNFLGEIDFEKKQLSFDASLYDSKLLAFTLTGDMAIRLYWGEDANFLLTVGGFHPAYQPPPMNLPDIRRITLSLTEGDNPRLRLETYFAVTSNTVQFGAKAEVYASAWKFNVYGFIAFDVLFQFSPFRFIAEVSSMLALRVGSSPFASIQLSFALEGPTPWSAKGTASFKICWFFTLKIRFSKTWGEQQNVPLPDVAVMPLLLAALNDNNNWTAELPRGRNLLVSTREVIPEAGLEPKIVAQPYGVLNISQKVVPLNLPIQKFGNLRPADGNLFRISAVQVGEDMSIPNPEAAKEYFAPAQFVEKSDAEKLSDKSFERYDSGIRLSENGQLKSAYAAARKVKYELSYIDSKRDQRLSRPDEDLHPPDVGAFNTWAVQGAVSKSDLSHARNRKPALAPEAVSLVEERFGVVFNSNLKLFDGGSLAFSELEAFARIETLVAVNPALRGRLQVVPVFEMNP